MNNMELLNRNSNFSARASANSIQYREPQDEGYRFSDPYNQVFVKVDHIVYKLNRIKLALKSNYFEKLFTECCCEKASRNIIEIPEMDSTTFSALLDIMSERNPKSIVNEDNYYVLLPAMDHLQMEIDLEIFNNFITSHQFFKTPVHLLFLHRYTSQKQNFEYFLPALRTCISRYLYELHRFQEFLTVPFDEVIRIIGQNPFEHTFIESKRLMGQICSRWICHQLETRLPKIVGLVNAVKYRYNFPSMIHQNHNVSVQFLHDIIDEEAKLAAVEKYFNRLLHHNGEIDVGELTLILKFSCLE